MSNNRVVYFLVTEFRGNIQIPVILEGRIWRECRYNGELFYDVYINSGEDYSVSNKEIFTKNQKKGSELMKKFNTKIEKILFELDIKIDELKTETCNEIDKELLLFSTKVKTKKGKK